ncbi:MAG: flagellin [Candidatus Solibacter sp.]|jgi:flagellar hook-associated protein 3 FlgL
MISNLSPSNQAFLANMDRLQRGVDEATLQTSSGKRVNVASDAPDELDIILQLRTDEVHNSQIQSNLGVAQADADAADSALSSATQLMDRATVLATQGANFTVDATGRQSIADEVESLLDQMTAISNTAVQGRYIFGGDQDGTPPYAVDLTQPNGVSRLTSSPATSQVENASGGSFAVSQNAQDIFDARNPDDTLAGDNVFAALNNLRLGLLANDTTQITAASASLQTASDHLNTAQAFYGTVENRITDATNYSASYDVQLKSELSQKEDADITTDAMTITQGNIQIEAAFQMQAKMPQTTLFDFMG